MGFTERQARRITGFVDTVRLRVIEVHWGDLVLPVLSIVAAFMLVSLLGQIDFAEVWDDLSEARWALIVGAALVGQFVYVTEAVGMRFATGHPLPLLPLAVLQLSVRWITLSVPSVPARIGMNAAFLTRFGVPATAAVVQGAIDSGAGFLVEAVLLIVGVLALDTAAEADVAVRWEAVLFVVVVVGLGAAIVTWRVRRLRDVVVPAIVEAWGVLVELIRDPLRATGLLLANFATRLILGAVLWLMLEAVGSPLSFFMALLVTVATNLLAGLVPIPGGIGVAEAALTSLLVLAGVDPEIAFATAVVFRVATFYVPAVAGWIATRWLRSNSFI